MRSELFNFDGLSFTFETDLPTNVAQPFEALMNGASIWFANQVTITDIPYLAGGVDAHYYIVIDIRVWVP